MLTEKLILVTTTAASAALTQQRLVNYAGGVCGAGLRALGVANANYDSGEQAGVKVSGEILVEAGAAIAQGVEVESNASGQVITKSAGIVVGVARDAATAAGQIIRIVR